MANNQNQCFFTGRIGNDLELRYTTSGTAIVNISLAVGKSWKKDGKKQEQTTWLRCIAFKNDAEYLMKFAQKGSLIRIESAFQERKWTDQQGQDRNTSEFLIRGLEIMANWKEHADPQNEASNQQPSSKDSSPPDFDDDIPF